MPFIPHSFENDCLADSPCLRIAIFLVVNQIHLSVDGPDAYDQDLWLSRQSTKRPIPQLHSDDSLWTDK